LLKKQKGICPVCNAELLNNEELEIYYIKHATNRLLIVNLRNYEPYGKNKKLYFNKYNIELTYLIVEAV